MRIGMRYFNHSWRTLSKRRCIIKLSLVAIITVTFFQSRHYYTIDISDDSFHQQSTCPACYGTDLCYAFTGQSNSKLQLQPSLWNRFLNTKNIYYGTLDNKRVVLKKLASDWELSLFNSFVCSLVLVNSNFTIQLSFQPSRCDVGKTLKHVVNIKLKRYHSPPDILWEITSLGKSFLEKRGISSDALQCNSRRFQSIIWSHFYSSGETSANVANLIMLFLINPEPIFLNIFSRVSPHEFPQYLGACGRVTVQEYVGPSLTHFRSDSLHLRLEIAKRLLHFAHNLTSHTEFGFNYFVTDVSYENFAVSNQGSQMFVKLVDVEGILVTDPQSVIKILGHHQQGMYVNPFGGHNSEMRFSTTDLCSHLAADHNFYAICECLLAEEPCTSDIPGGLLWDVGTLGTNSDWPIRSLIDACQTGSQNRINASYKLIRVIDNVLNVLKNER